MKTKDFNEIDLFQRTANQVSREFATKSFARQTERNDEQHPTNVWSAQPRLDVDSSHLHRSQRRSLGKIMDGLKADNTLGRSQAVLHPITNWALRRLTSEVARNLLYLTLYGRQRHQWK